MIARLKSALSSVSSRVSSRGLSGWFGATELPSQPLPQVKGPQQSLPSYLNNAKPNPAMAFLLADRRLASKDISTYRSGTSTRQTIRDFARSSPDLSAAVASYIRAGITDSSTAVAKNPDGTLNPQATAALAHMLTRMNVLNDYTIGYDSSPSVRSLCETWAGELIMYGGCAGELVLDKARLPSHVHPVSLVQIKLFPSADGKKLVPKQVLSSTTIDLDMATFFMVTLDQDALEPYAQSPIESAIPAVVFSAEFMNDIRRVVRRAIHPRVTVTINEEKFRRSIPQEVQFDPQALSAHMNEVIAQVAQQINGLSPEEALVLFDTMGFEVKDHGNTNLSHEYSVLSEFVNSKMATGAKVLPTVLGYADGSSNTASAEVLMFMKYVNGTVLQKLNEMLSKVLTLAVRLLGHDVVVEFKFAAIDLRPDSELEAFRAMKQSRVLELLSLGLVSDEEAAVELTGHLPPSGYRPLAGSGFRANTGLSPVGQGFNGHAQAGGQAQAGGPHPTPPLNGPAPEQAKSQNKK